MLLWSERWGFYRPKLCFCLLLDRVSLRCMVLHFSAKVHCYKYIYITLKIYSFFVFWPPLRLKWGLSFRFVAWTQWTDPDSIKQTSHSLSGHGLEGLLLTLSWKHTAVLAFIHKKRFYIEVFNISAIKKNKKQKLITIYFV